jgi:hypothetical protein
VGQEKSARRSQNRSTAGSLKKPFAHLVLEFENLLAERWLGDSAFNCCPAKIAGTSHGDKIA